MPVVKLQTPSKETTPKKASDATSIHPVILCGGSGTRLWPLSRASSPKQFANILGDQSLFQDTAKRLSGNGYTSPIILTGEKFRFVVSEQLEDVGITPDTILIEPAARNTAPAILAAALWIARTDPKAVMLVAPADHVVPDKEAFHAIAATAAAEARNGAIITFGISPTHPETGYGYLEMDTAEPLQDAALFKLKRFVEKPDEANATKMLAAGNYLWNAGIFMMTAETIINAFKQHAPQFMEPVEAAVANGEQDLNFHRLGADAFAGAPNDSIDYAIMEKADNLVVAPCDFKWNDLGAWGAVWDESVHDTDGNALSQASTAIDCKNTLLRSNKLHLVGIGLEDMVVVAEGDAVLVAPKDQAQKVKQAVDEMKAKDVPAATAFPRDNRPWGWYESIATGDRFQVKRIVVKPDASLSLQSHHHRAEHWIVVAGTAKVTIDDKVSLISENQSVYIPIGAVHRLENPGKLPVVLIEVQTGAYLGEDDIIRYEDKYSRN